jgi:trigger factor
MMDELMDATAPQGSGTATDVPAQQEMQVSVERTSDIERKVTVEIGWQKVKSQLDEAYRELQHGVAIKGFRRGKVPRRMLEQLFGKHVTQEVAQRMVQDTIQKAFTEEGITPVSEPKIVDEGIKEGESFHYSATVQVVPEIDPKDYFGVEVKGREPRVSDEDVDLALRMKQREMTDFRSLEGRSTQAGDVLLVDLMGKLGAEPYSKEQELIELGDAPQEPLPGLAAALTGIPSDKEELEVELDVPVHAHAEGEPCPENEVTQKARLLVTIKDAKQKVVPEIDDDFARDTGEADTLAGLREVLRKKLLTQDERRAREETKRTLLKELVRRNDVPLVPSLVEKQVDQDVRMQLAMLGVDPNSPHLPLEALKERLRDEAVETVKGALLLEAISKKEKVEVVDAEVEQKLAEIASSRSQNVARVRSEYEKEGRLQGLRGRIREDKTLDLLLAKANIAVEKNSTETGAESNTPNPDVEP